MADQRAVKAIRTTKEEKFHLSIDSLVQKAQKLVAKHPNQALALCNEADELLQHNTYPQGLIETALVRANVLTSTNQLAQAKTALRSIASLCAQHGTLYQKACLAHQRGMICYNESPPNYGEALLYIEESIQLFQQVSAPLDEARATLLLGTIYTNVDMYDNGLEQGLRALSLFTSVDNKQGISKSLNNIGTVYNQNRQFDKALEFFHKSLAIKREIRDTEGEANTLNNIANILFWTNKEYDKALEYYNQSLALSTKHGHTSIRALALQHIGQIYVYLQQFDKAIQYGTQALEINRREQRQYYTAYALMDLGFVYTQANQIDRGIEFIQEGVEIALNIQAKHLITKGYNLLRQIYRILGDFESATTYCEKYIDIQAQLFSETSEKKVQQLTIQFEVEKAQQEKELYRLRSERLEQEIEHKAKELTTTAMLLTQKNEFLGNINRQIEKALVQHRAATPSLLQSLHLQIRENMRSEDSWEYFEQQFKLVHHDFTQRVSELYPTLTPMELKISALLRMHLSTKEIANLLYQSPRSIEAYRYRLRKKMDLPVEVNLPTFLASL